MTKKTKRMRSGLEDRIALQLDALVVAYEYEEHVLKYDLLVRGMRCLDCGSKHCATIRKYTPDFWLPEHKFFIEAKGLWTGVDRSKHLAVQEANPDVEIRFLFQYNNWLTKKHKSKYTDWCDSHGYKYAIGEVPKEWLLKI